MTKLHLKSKCCNAKVIKFGGNRRQCVLCKKTWRIRPKRRGRKVKRISTSFAKNYLDNKYSSILRLSTLNNRYKLKRKLRRSILIHNKATVYPELPQEYPLIAILDSMMHKINRQIYSTYFILIKKTTSEYAYISKPMIASGKENPDNWDKAFLELPESIRSSIAAIVGDKHRGILHIAKKYNILYQSCHFHLIFKIMGRRSKSKWSRHQKRGGEIINHKFWIIIVEIRDYKILFYC